MTADRLLGGMAAACLGAVGVALVSQHQFDMQPCAWCVLQRLIFVLIAAVALAGLLWRSRLGQRTVALAVLVLCGLGIASALWQHFVAASAASCALTWPDKFMTFTQLDGLLPEVFQPRASCAEAKVNLLGVPYEFWSMALFVLIELAAVLVLRKAHQAHP
jgi:protein dithiol:quinone oxidoreductase